MKWSYQKNEMNFRLVKFKNKTIYRVIQGSWTKVQISSF